MKSNSTNQRPIQYFSDEYLERCKGMSIEQILQALDDFRRTPMLLPLQEKSKLISIRIQPSLLAAFKAKARQEGVSYQKKIKDLMFASL